MSEKKKAQELVPLNVGVEGAAKLLGICASMVHKLDRRGAMPEPFRIGRRKLWRTQELVDWNAAKCPSRIQWSKVQKRS